MASTKQPNQYPDYLNPFGDDDDDDGQQHPSSSTKQLVAPQKDPVVRVDDYPDYLSPFDDDSNMIGVEGLNSAKEDYDNSLNPFGDEEDQAQAQNADGGGSTSKANSISQGNPFDEDEDEQLEKDEQLDKVSLKQSSSLDTATTNSFSSPATSIPSHQPDSLEPPVPLPRTKSLLKKEQAQRNRQKQQKQEPIATDSVQMTSVQSNENSSSSSNITTTITTSTDSFQRKKNKRNAPPVPINFKRQVSGSLDAIEEELNEIGDKMAIIEKESNLCQKDLLATHQVDEAQFAISRSKFIELIKRRNSVVRRQKELMYRKRELKLDQIHSDIEYELRMIGNKQLSHRTSEDDIREKELLKKLVEIVEEKSDIVENLNKDASCDKNDIEEAFRRLNISNKESVDSESTIVEIKTDVNAASKVPIKNGNCDKSSGVLGNKLSKMATLLPKSGTLKGTMKLKRKRLFKKCETRPIER